MTSLAINKNILIYLFWLKKLKFFFIFNGLPATLTSFVIICAASGEMILPVIVANVMHTDNFYFSQIY